jgi:hypothetical protein
MNKEEGRVDLLQESPPVINIGIAEFYEALVAQEVEAIQVDWRPPAEGDEELTDLLEELLY